MWQTDRRTDGQTDRRLPQLSRASSHADTRETESESSRQDDDHGLLNDNIPLGNSTLEIPGNATRWPRTFHIYPRVGNRALISPSCHAVTYLQRRTTHRLISDSNQCSSLVQCRVQTGPQVNEDGDYIYNSTWIRRPFDCLSSVTRSQWRSTWVSADPPAQQPHWAILFAQSAKWW